MVLWHEFFSNTWLAICVFHNINLKYEELESLLQKCVILSV